jgi:hypothetical protein
MNHQGIWHDGANAVLARTGIQLFSGRLHRLLLEVCKHDGCACLGERPCCASPIPDAAPVTSATLPLKSNALLMM